MPDHRRQRFGGCTSDGLASRFSVLTTNQKGSVAETAIAHEALKLGIGVYVPIGDERADLILDLRPRLLRVQCKWACGYGDVIVVRLYSARRAREGLRRTFYSDAEVDAFAAYSPDTNQCYFFAMADLPSRNEIRLRIGPTRNNQAAGVHWAREYEFRATLVPLLGP